ncbi:MAG: hypothetical protein IJA82_00325 [Clostridia bacterium]|nr:hypothetical protein [Clostridia bacterium]
MKKKVKSKDEVFQAGKINDVASSFAENEINDADYLNPLDDDISKILVSSKETINNQRINLEKDKQVMSTLEEVLAIKEKHIIDLKDYYIQLINMLLDTTNYAYRKFTLTKEIDASAVLSEKIMHIINAVALGIINEIEFVNPISFEIQLKEDQIDLSYKAYVEIMDNLNSDEIISLYPCISTRWNYINSVCAEHCLESALTIKNKQLEIKYLLPVDVYNKSTLKNDPFSQESKESILYYLDMFTY